MNSNLKLTEEQAWILRRVIEAAVQLLTNENDIKKCVTLFPAWGKGPPLTDSDFFEILVSKF